MFPALPHGKATYTRSVVQMKDITYRDYADDGEIRDSYGITSSEAPYIKTANARLVTDEDVDDITEWNGLVTLKDGIVYYNGEAVGNVSPGKKQFAVVNTKLVIFPDKTYIDLTTRETGKLDAEVSSAANGAEISGGNKLTITPESKMDDIRFSGSTNPRRTEISWVNTYSSVGIFDGEVVKTGKKPMPVSLLAVGDIVCPNISDIGAYTVSMANGEYVATMQEYEALDPSEYPDIPTDQEADDGTYATVEELQVEERTKIKYTATCSVHFAFQVDLTDVFTVGDALTVSDAAGNTYCDKAIALEITSDTITFADGTFETALTIPTKTTVKRDVPDLDYICESENRLWGCAGNSIYASALGDPTNFYQYGEESTSSYAVAVSSEDKFTGCCKYSSSVLFFKEKCIHKILGSYPAEYSLYTSYSEGVKDGCSRSLVTINNVLYYYGLHGAYAYTGGTPQLVSVNFGNKRFSEAVGGTDGRFYFLSVKEGDDGLYFAYDIRTGIWCKEADRYCGRFVLVGTNMTYLEDGTVYDADTGGQADGIDWLVRFAPFGRSTEAAYMHKAQYERLIFHADIPSGSTVNVYVSADGAPRKLVKQFKGINNNYVWTAVVPVNRTENYGLELTGHGRCTIRTITREYQERSDR